MRRAYYLLSALAVCFFLGGCAATLGGAPPAVPMPGEVDGIVSGYVPRNEIQRFVKQGLRELRKGDCAEASGNFEAGLRLDGTNGYLHFLNAMAYHMRSESGDPKMLDLAQSGYQMALRFDESNYYAAYLLGHIYFDRKNFRAAQNQFSYGLLYAPDNPYLLRALSIASYYSNDLGLHKWAATRAYGADAENPLSLRTLMFSRAATGDAAGARKLLEQYDRSLQGKDRPVGRSSQSGAGPVGRSSQSGAGPVGRSSASGGRIRDWQLYYASADPTIFGDSVTPGDVLDYGGWGDSGDSGDGSDTGDWGDTGSSADTGDAVAPDATDSAAGPAVAKEGDTSPKLPKMALVDVTIIRTEEFKTDSKGVNLLSGLQATLSGTLFSYNRQKGRESGTKIDNETIGISPMLNLMDLEYNLNIFNQGSSKAEVLARPSLLAIENQTSKFFSGGTLHVQISGNISDGTLVDIPIGLHLSVTPQFYGDDTVKVAVRAERSFLEEGSQNVGFPSFSQTSTTSVEATAVLKFGETLVLSGLSENEHDRSRDGVPFLQSVPIVKYLFSRDEKLDTKKSVLILLTPRKARYSKAGVAGVDLEDDAAEAQSVYTASLKKENRIAKSNIDAVVAHLSKDNRFYRQFRTGDLELDSWKNAETLSAALRRVLGFL